MKERPIIFKGWSVRAILAGRKTMTRRVVRGVVQTHDLLKNIDDRAIIGVRADDGSLVHGSNVKCPYGVPGDRLWVRETWSIDGGGASGYWVVYRANIDASPVIIGRDDECQRLFDYQRGEWRPSIHMPRWASRILLEITDIRVERVRDISHEDSIAEGMSLDKLNNYGTGSIARDAFAETWDSIHGPGAFERNDWVWVISFAHVK